MLESWDREQGRNGRIDITVDPLEKCPVSTSVTRGTSRHGGHVEQCVVRGGVNGGQWHERARSGPPGATSHRLA